MKLAWASLPERAIHARLANQLLRGGGSFQHGDVVISKVKDAVRSITFPPRGFLQKRTVGAAAEMMRQRQIHLKRARSTPYEWARPRLQDRRNNVARARISLTLGSCSDVRTITGHALYLANAYISYHSSSYIYVRHFATGATDVIPVADNAKTVAAAIFFLHEKEIARVVQHGGFYTVNFCRAVTTLHPLDGPSVDLFWPVASANHPLPRKSCCCEKGA